MNTNVFRAGQVPSFSSSQHGGEGDGRTAGASEKVIRTFRGILNKFTPEKFESLIRQVDELNINDEETLNTVVELVVDKALSEQSYSATYAQMCHHLKELRVSSQSSDGFVYFHKRLLSRCQMEFENRGLVKEKEKNVSAAQEDPQQTRHKTHVRLLGTVRFIGELFKLKMIWEAIIHTCIVKLIKDECDDSLECLCKLLSIVGKGLDNEAERPKLNSYYCHICYLLKEKKMTPRIKFMLQDIVALRKNNWVPRRNDQGPKTIQQLHQEVKQAEEREQLQYEKGQTTIQQRGGGRLADRRQSFNVKVIPEKVNQKSSHDCNGEKKQQGHLGSSSCNGISKKPVEQKTPPKQAAALSQSFWLCNEEEVHRALKRLLQEKPVNGKIEEWIQNNFNYRQRSSEGFVRALVRAVCQSVIVNCGVYTLNTYELLDRVSLLKKYITDAQKQLLALNVLQQLVGHIDQPDGLLRMFFDVLWDEEVIQDETYFKWRSSTVSAKSVCNFFAMLEEANRRFN
ncbi:eukaryotic translation initiation factor 4 gamma 3-like [Takifugu flavidus]|uniref:Eukaryotic translation initiation factor 4 gamma 1 n=1 Tax=Takifugu flavidus TaxID=433684 RepID=A0A5C6NP32_9TELE|nr:eukaryotic translation initiation factor 4 gamma 3-like [Takifugu flavidus]TWW67940.1 Eukaryotic translation initiation factor 4 gamma 1 [Takifugu flavidus]